MFYVLKSTVGCSLESGLQGTIVENACKTLIVVLREMGKGNLKLGPWVIRGAMSHDSNNLSNIWARNVTGDK